MREDIHILSNAVEADHPEAVWLILKNNSMIIDEHYHAKYEDAFKSSYKYVARKVT